MPSPAWKPVLQVPDFTAEVLRRRLGLLQDAGGDHLLFHTRVGTPLAPNNARRTLRKMLDDAGRKMLDDAGLSDLKVTPHAFRRTAGTVIARAPGVETAADVLGNSPEIAKKRDGEWVMFAFHNVAADGSFIGSISDPMPVRWEGQEFHVMREAISARGVPPEG